MLEDEEQIYENLFMHDTTTSLDARGVGNSFLRSGEDEAWDLIEDNRLWKDWIETIKKAVEKKQSPYVN